MLRELTALPDGSFLAGTGHRPSKLGGHRPIVFTKLVEFAVNVLSVLRPSWLISGLALGWDQAIALAAFDLDIPVCGAVPFKGQERLWPEDSQALYNEILRHCAETVTVCSGDYSASKMFKRDRWMVDRGSHVLANWNGSPGGTGHTVHYAECGPTGRPL